MGAARKLRSHRRRQRWVDKCARVQLIKNRKNIAVFVPNDGCLNYIEENDEVLIAGFGHAVDDIPGVRFKFVSGFLETIESNILFGRNICFHPSKYLLQLGPSEMFLSISWQAGIHLQRRTTGPQ